MDTIQSARAARQLGDTDKVLILHLPDDWMAKVLNGDIDFFRKLETRSIHEGYSCVAVKAGTKTAQMLLDTDHLHVSVGGPPGLRRNTLHAMPGYIWGFWYLDELGTNWNSSLRFANFCAADVDFEKAEYFFNGVSGYMLRENVSISPQEVRVHNPLRGALATVFCQEIEANRDRSHFLTTEEMIRTAAEYDRDALVYVKLHPQQSKRARSAIMAITQDYPNVKLSESSIHDLIEASDVVITQNSTAGFEALMQKCPVITCAKSDYWHATLTARSVADLREALSYGAEAMADFPYEKYFYWFLARHCLEPAKDNFTARAWARIRSKAFL